MGPHRLTPDDGQTATENGNRVDHSQDHFYGNQQEEIPEVIQDNGSADRQGKKITGVGVRRR